MAQKSNSVPTSKWVALAAALFFMFATAVIPPFEGLSQSGFQVLGILVGASILFLTWGTDWTSMLVVFAFMTVPALSINQITQATFGNSTVVFLIFTFMLAGCLTKSGVARRIAVWFITNKLARKSPWWTVAMILIAMYIISMPLSSAATFMIMFPIVQEILASVGVTKEDKAPIATALILGLLVMGLISNGGNPIAHAMTLQGFSFFQSYTGQAMDFFAYCAIATPVSIIGAVFYFLIVRFVWRPDVSVLTQVDYEKLTSGLGAMSKKEKWSVGFYVACILLWLLPGLTQYVWPAAYSAVFSKVQQCMPPLVALFLMNFIKADGEPVFKWSDAVSCVPVGMVFFMVSIMGIGAFMGNPDIGIAAWLTTVLSPVFANVSATMFTIIMLVFCGVLCSFCTGSIPLAITFAVAMPLCSTIYEGQINPMVLGALATLLANTTWTTAPCSPISAIAYSSGWVVPKNMVKYGLMTTIIIIIAALTVGVGIGNIF